MPGCRPPAQKNVVGVLNAYGSEGPVENLRRRIVGKRTPGLAHSLNGDSGPPLADNFRRLKIISINVTALTAVRLKAVLLLAKREDAHLILLQESRHPADGFAWAARMGIAKGWKSQWSKPSPNDRLGRRTPGGTAIFWRKELGRGTPVSCDVTPSSAHRACGRSWKNFDVWSVYGNAEKSDSAWLSSLLQSGQRGPRSAKPCVMAGDYNWRNVYDKLIVDDWAVSERIGTVKKGNAAPTRCLSKFSEVPIGSTCDIPGIPHHQAVCYTANLEAPACEQVTRLRKCGKHQWFTPPNAIEAARLFADTDAAATKAGYAGPLRSALDTWHLRAEAVFKSAESMQLAVGLVKAERSKGSMPTARPVADKAVDGADDTINVRRLKTLRRACDEQSNSRGKSAKLSEPQNAKNAARRMDWRRTFRNWGLSALRSGAKVLKPMSSPPAFSASEMRSDWKCIWNRIPEGADHGEAWVKQATDAGMVRKPARTWVPPTLDRFREAILATNGAAGFDGWDKEEVRALLAYAPWIIEELLVLLTRLTREAQHGLSPDIRDAVFAWRVVGIPKRDPGESRPIAIASFLLRAWQKCIMDSLPPSPEGQWCEVGVLPATADFLAKANGLCTAGAELDLAKAYDNVLHDPAAAALAFEGTPPEVVGWLTAAWTAKRVCNVNGELADPIQPTSGILPGDPTSGRVLSILLMPWHALMTKQDVAPAAYADDRSIKAAGNTTEEAKEKVDKALEVTASFDSAVGLSENVKKRQRWSTGESAEHLGLNLQLGGPPLGEKPTLPEPRDGWNAIDECTKRIFMVPGGLEIRKGIARACILPKFCWAAPFIQQPPSSLARSMYAQLLRTGCTWWCVARFWADHVLSHPNFAMAIQSLKNAALLPFSVVLGEAVKQHAAVLKLVAFWNSDGSLRLRHGVDADYRTVAASQTAADGDDGFDPRAGAGGHALRVAARVCALALKPRGAYRRKDKEGIDTADVEATSQGVWKKWARTLDIEDRRLLRIWRGGCARTPTRTAHRTRVEDAKCIWCDHPFASARHFWQECVKFRPLRRELEDEFGINPEWWRQQPSCTSKSGWITTSAAPEAARRAELQMAACRLGIAILRASAPPEESSGATW